MARTYFELIKGSDEIKARDMKRAQRRDMNPEHLLRRGEGVDALIKYRDKIWAQQTDVIGRFDTLDEARRAMKDFAPSCRYCSGPVPFYTLNYAYIEENTYSTDEDGQEEFVSCDGGWDLKATFPFIEWMDLSNADLERWGYWDRESWGSTPPPEDADDIICDANEKIDDFRKNFLTTEVDDAAVQVFSANLWEHYCSTGRLD